MMSHGRWRRTAFEGAIILSFLAAYFAPNLILGKSSYVLIHDNLDSELVYLHNLAESGTMFRVDSRAVIPQVMNGLPRTAMRSGLDVVSLVFVFLDPFWGYVLLSVIVRIVAIVGMILLLRRYVLPEPRHRLLSLGVALAFALVPFYVLYGVSVAGQPLLLYSMLNIRAGRSTAADWLWAGLFPFFSVLYLIGIFALIVLGLLYLWDVARTRRLHWPFAVAILLVLGGYLVSEAPMLLSMLAGSGWQTHRVEFQIEYTRSLTRSAWELLVVGPYHAGLLLTVPALAAAALAATVDRADPRLRWVLGLGLLIFAIFAFHVIYPYLTGGVVGRYIPVTRYVQLDRFYFLLPLCWTLLLAVSLGIVSERERLVPLAGFILFVHAGSVAIQNKELRYSAEILLGGSVPEPTYEEFFAPELFEAVAKSIGRPQDTYRVVAVGLHPSVLQMNGFYTLDGYQNNYPLSYKRQFRRIIRPELERDPRLRRYFDDWGNRSYVFSSELGRRYLWGKRSRRRIKELRIDAQALADLSGEYVVSAVPIDNHKQIGLRERGTFQTPTSHWQIRLYEVDLAAAGRGPGAAQ